MFSVTAAGGIPALVALLQVDSEEVQSVAASVLCNIVEHEPIKQALTKANAAPILIKLLSSSVDDIQSRAAIVLRFLAGVEDNQNTIADQQGIPALVCIIKTILLLKYADWKIVVSKAW